MVNNKETISLNKIFTHDIGRFNKSCLIFSSDPVETALDIYCRNFNNFFKESDRTIFEQIRLDNILTKYNREIEIYKKLLDRVENKSDNGIIKQNKENNKKDCIKEESWQKQSKMHDERPTWDFPLELQLCSIEHLHKVKCINMPNINGLISAEDLPTDSKVSIEILTLLASGIGIYSTDHPSLDDTYLKSVILLAKKV